MQRFLGIAAAALVVAGNMLVAGIGFKDGAPAESWRQAVADAPFYASAGGLLVALAGIALLLFLSRIASQKGFPSWARSLGSLWATTWLIGGMIVATAAEMADYQQHAEGTKTVLVVGYLLVVSPIGAVLAGGFAIGVAATDGPWPRGYRRLSLALGALAVALGVFGGLGGIGLAGLAPAAIWLLVSAVAMPTWLAAPGPAPQRTGIPSK